MTGMAQSHYQLGMNYFHGKGTEQNFSEALKWFRLAAQQQHAKAEFMIGRMYDAGKGCEQNPPEAVLWYQKSARNGYAPAQN